MDAWTPRRSGGAAVTAGWSPRALAAEVLLEVEADDAYANLLLPKRLTRSGLDARDAGFATELVYGTLRNRGWYDAVLAFCTPRPVAELDPPVRVALRLGAHQLLSMRVPAHAAIAETVDAARMIGVTRAAGLVNAALRRVSERSVESWDRALAAASSPEAFEATRLSHPVWIARALGAALRADGRSAELHALMEADNVAPTVSLVALPGLASRDDYAVDDFPRAEYSPIGMSAPSGDPAAVMKPGKVRVQDQGSQLAALALTRARPIHDGERWLDACAGPGGKAAVMLAEGAGRVQFDWNELASHRAGLVRQAIEGIPFAQTGYEGDARELMADNPEGWDRILLDAPCTGLGALRRRPEARWRKSPADLSVLTALQAKLLDGAVSAVKPGGVIAYVTCSPHLAETQRQVEGALRRNPGLSLLDTRAVMESIAPGIPLGEQTAGVQLWPHIHHSDAMFVSLLTRN